MCYNVTLLVVFQRGSSTLAVVASAARLVLSNVFFLIPVLAGPVVSKSFPAYDIIALVGLVLGIGLYQLQAETKKEDVLKDEESSVPIDSMTINDE